MLAARRLNRAAGTIAASVLIDSAMEHYRGDFKNKAMYTPIATSVLALLASFHGHKDSAQRAHWARDIVYALAGLTGVVGTGFHLYNVGKRPGGFCWQNLFYGAPLGAPAAISLAGMTGFLAERVRDNAPGAPPDVLGLPAGRVVAALTGAGLVGTAMEAGLLHFRGAFHNPAMLLPVTAPPAAAVMLAMAAFGEADRPRRLTRLMAAIHRAHGRHRRRLPRDRGGAQHGGLAELDSEPSGGSAAAGPAVLYRPRAGRSRSVGTAAAGQPR